MRRRRERIQILVLESLYDVVAICSKSPVFPLVMARARLTLGFFLLAASTGRKLPKLKITFNRRHGLRRSERLRQRKLRNTV